MDDTKPTPPRITARSADGHVVAVRFRDQITPEERVVKAMFGDGKRWNITRKNNEEYYTRTIALRTSGLDETAFKAAFDAVKEQLHIHGKSHIETTWGLRPGGHLRMYITQHDFRGAEKKARALLTPIESLATVEPPPLRPPPAPLPEPAPKVMEPAPVPSISPAEEVVRPKPVIRPRQPLDDVTLAKTMKLLFIDGSDAWRKDGTYYLLTLYPPIGRPFKLKEMEACRTVLRDYCGLEGINQCSWYEPFKLAFQITPDQLQSLKDQGLGKNAIGELKLDNALPSGKQLHYEEFIKRNIAQFVLGDGFAAWSSPQDSLDSSLYRRLAPPPNGVFTEPSIRSVKDMFQLHFGIKPYVSLANNELTVVLSDEDVKALKADGWGKHDMGDLYEHTRMDGHEFIAMVAARDLPEGIANFTDRLAERRHQETPKAR